MIFLDNASTTPLSDSVKSHVISILDDYGNPSSIHQLGSYTRGIVEESRKQVAKFINAENEMMVLFTSSGSASNTLGVKCFLEKNDNYDVYFSPICHNSINMIIKSLKNNNSYKIPVNHMGVLDLEWLNEQLDININTNHLVVISAADSEIGTIQKMRIIDNICAKHNCILYVDYTAQIPYFELDVQQFKTQNLMIGFSGHKLHSLKGVGVFYKRGNYEISPLIYGKQELSLVGGTENILAISSLGKAVSEYDYSSINYNDIDYLWNKIQKNISDVYLVGTPIDIRLPKNLYICIKNVEAESLLLMLDMDGICVSTGSACNSNSLIPNNSLVEIGLEQKDYFSCIRISLPDNISKNILDHICDRLKCNVENLRKMKNK